jgi:NACalpha-BTF3-like transcription factor
MYELTLEASPEEKLSFNDPEVLDDILENDLIVYTNPWGQEEWNDMYKWNTLVRSLEAYKYLESKGISIKKNKMYRKNLETGEMLYAGFDAEVSSMYFKFLEYTAKKKFVMRMMGAYDNKGALTKTKDKKEYKSRFGDTPVKVGERDIAVIASQLGIENVETVHQFLTQTDSDVVNTIIAFFKVMGVQLKVDDEIQDRLAKYYQNINITGGNDE